MKHEYRLMLSGRDRALFAELSDLRHEITEPGSLNQYMFFKALFGLCFVSEFDRFEDSTMFGGRVSYPIASLKL